MSISNARRYYLTLPSKEYKTQLVMQAKKAGKSTSRYIVYRLELLETIEKNTVGAALIKDISNGQ